MTRNDFIRLLEETLEMDKGSLKGGEALSDLDMWDSLAVVSFIALVDEQLDLTLNPEQIAQAKTIPDMMELVAHKLND